MGQQWPPFVVLLTLRRREDAAILWQLWTQELGYEMRLESWSGPLLQWAEYERLADSKTHIVDVYLQKPSAQ